MMTLYDYVCNAHRSYSGAERTDIWWENSGFGLALRDGLRQGMQLTAEDYMKFAQHGYDRGRVLSAMFYLSPDELARSFGSYALLTAAVMRECDVSREIATDVIERIGMDVGRWFQETLEDMAE